jgi:hypothetical protein
VAAKLAHAGVRRQFLADTRASKLTITKMKCLTLPDTNNLIMNIKLKKIEVTVGINLKWPNIDYPSFYLVGRHLTFPVTTKRYNSWVEFMFPTLRFDRLY